MAFPRAGRCISSRWRSAPRIVEDLRRVRAQRHAERGESWVYTRNHPRRAAEAVLDGGSIYWVVKGQIRARERVIGFRTKRDDNGRAYCLIEVDGRLVPTLARPWRPFQGWRYLAPEDAPPDRAQDGVLPPERMLAELRALGLL